MVAMRELSRLDESILLYSAEIPAVLDVRARNKQERQSIPSLAQTQACGRDLKRNSDACHDVYLVYQVCPLQRIPRNWPKPSRAGP